LHPFKEKGRVFASKLLVIFGLQIEGEAIAGLFGVTLLDVLAEETPLVTGKTGEWAGCLATPSSSESPESPSSV
jgi:hypothetical protein